ncbi:BrnA antitoxin family protein [Acidithiobacillus sp. MC6.1]|nr:BrnA antitoxin family protein [Acidithiobacillus sp. MC6.1]
MSDELVSELRLENRPDAEIDLSDMPEVIDWANTVRGKFYRPIKKPVNIRVDADVLAWFKSRSGRYQTMMNEALREYVTKHNRQDAG